MGAFVVVAFPNVAMTRQVIDAIKRMRAEGSIKVYAAVVVARDPTGKLSIEEVTKRGHGATAVGALIGSLAALPFGPLAMTIGAAGGALIGYSAELLHEGDAAELVQKTSRDLARGEAAVLLEIAEDGLIRFSALMERFGGIVLRK